MQRSFLRLVIFTLLIAGNHLGGAVAFAQYPQLEYPLHIGDLWQFRDPSEPPPGYVYSKSIVGDTVMPNGLAYAVVNDGLFGIHLYYYRKSGSKVYQYTTMGDSSARNVEVLVYDFSKKVGDTVSVFWSARGDTAVVTVFDEGASDLFGVIRHYMTFYQRMVHQSFYSLDVITDSIGMTFNQIEPGVQSVLTGAVINGSQYGTIANIKRTPSGASSSLILCQNYPNPFNGSTVITYTLPSELDVKLDVCDILGRSVKLLLHEKQREGNYFIEWDGKNDHSQDVSSGVYFFRIEFGLYVGVKKMILVR